MHLALGNGEFAPFKVKEFAAYERQTRAMLQEFVAGDARREPAFRSVSRAGRALRHLQVGPHCSTRRRNDDDLSLVAGVTSRQRRVLKGAGVTTRRELAGLDPLPHLAGVGRRLSSAPTCRPSSRSPARMTARSATSCSRRTEPQRASSSPTAGCWPCRSRPTATSSSTSRELATTPRMARSSACSTSSASSTRPTLGADGAPAYTQIWAFDRQGEKRAFEELIDFITERRERHPRSARLSLQPLRTDVDRPPDRAARHAGRGRRALDGSLRDPRGRGRRPVQARCVRRPVPGRSTGTACGRRELLDQVVGSRLRIRTAG